MLPKLKQTHKDFYIYWRTGVRIEVRNNFLMISFTQK